MIKGIETIIMQAKESKRPSVINISLHPLWAWELDELWKVSFFFSLLPSHFRWPSFELPGCKRGNTRRDLRQQ
jgi:hypothetical protein